MVDIGTVIALIKALGSGGGGGGGTSDYDDLTNKPQINSVTLSGNKSGDDLGLLDAPETAGTIGQVLTSDGQGGQSWETPSSGGVSDVQVAGTSVVTSGVANVPIGIDDAYGVFKVRDFSHRNSGAGIYVNNGVLAITGANDATIKAGTTASYVLTPSCQDKSVFYGLAKIAGADEKSSSLTVGTYTATAKSAIQSMLGVEPGVSFVETVTGTTPTITGEANVRYICGEVSTLSITPPPAGTIVVRFTSGSTATVLTLPQTVIFPAGVDLTTLDADTVYEIMITDGVYGGAMTWAVSA